MRRALFILLLSLTLMPAAAQAATVGACTGYTPNVSVGTQAKVSPGAANRIRQSPGLNAARTGEMASGSVFSVMSGPTCADNLTWWLVRYQTITGWTAEGEGTTHWLQPASGQNHAPKQPPESLGGTSTSVFYELGLCVGVLDNRALNGFGGGNELSFVPGQDLLSVEPGVCAPTDAAGEVAAISPFGFEMPADLLYVDGRDVVRVTLPDIAYTIPGQWALRVRSYMLYVDVQPPPEAFMQGTHSEDGSYTMMLGGFQPNERIVIVTSRTTADAVGYTPDEGEVEQSFDEFTGVTEITINPEIFSAIQDLAVLDTPAFDTRPGFVIQPDIAAGLDGTLTALPEFQVDQVSELVFGQLDASDMTMLDDLGMSQDTGSSGGIFGLTFQDFTGTEVVADANGFVYTTVRLDGSPLAAIGQSGALAVWPNLAALYVPGGGEAALRQTLYDAYWKDAGASEPVSCTYTVASGDTLNHIARDHNITLEQLLAANPQVTNPDVIFRGLVLNLPNCSP